MEPMDISVAQARYRPCDSFFTESDDHDMASRVREHQRALAKIRARQLDKELSTITSDEYLEEILDHMEHMESITMPDVASIEIQHEIQWYMRPYLIDFLIEAHIAFQLLPETLYLTVNLLDRYCSRRVVYKRHYQLVGCAALLIAAKYGDKKERVPTFRELRSMCCDMYEEEMFLQMEWHVLQTLDWVLGHPTIDSFLQIALGECNEDYELGHMAWYICELALYHKEFVSVRPSVMARSSLALARGILGRPQAPYEEWSGRYDADTVLKLVNYLPQPSDVLARKFSTAKMSAVAQTVENFLQTQPATPSVETRATQVIVQEAKPQSYGTPQTPSKSTYSAAIMQHGCWTPPITPDGEHSAAAGCYGRPPSHYPATPSPVPSHHSLGSHSTGHHSFDSHSMDSHSVGSHSIGPHSMSSHHMSAHTISSHSMGSHPLASHPMGSHQMNGHPRQVVLSSQPYDVHPHHFFQPKPVL